jgi:maleate isomerase/arylmalonate decarboxylase
MMSARHASTYGARAKLGLIVPPTNTVNEAEWWRLVPAGVSVHTARMPLHADTESAAGRAALLADLDRATGDLAAARVDVVAYGCTAGSMIDPPEALEDEIGARTGQRAVTTAAAIVRALRRLAARRLAVATPYHDALNDHERRFLTACGFEVVRIEGLGIGAAGPQDYVRIAETPLATVREHALGVVTAAAEALLVTCTDLPTLPLIDGLEAATGLPVVTSNQATLWAALVAAGVPDPIGGAGRLLTLPRTG